jgi:hypothetical protein
MLEEKTALPVTSSAEPELCAGQRLYKDVLRILEANRVPHAVSGAFALREHTGVGRPVKDLDIFLTSETAGATLDLLCKQGFRCEICDPIWLAKAHRGDFFVDFITGMSNAALIVTDSWIDRAQPTEVLGVPTRVLAAEELLASKMFVVRRERFDGAQSHFVPLLVWTQLVNRLMYKLLNPDPAARFRGSLVDENMFAIDVNEWGLDDLLSEYRALRGKNIEWPSDGVEARRGAA